MKTAKKIRVLHCLNEIKFSGAELMISNSMELFIANNIESTSIATGDHVGEFSKIFRDRGILTWHLPKKKRISLVELWNFHRKFYQLIIRENIDVIHIHRSDLIIPALAARILKLPCIKTQHNVFHNPWYTRPIAIITRWIARNFLKVQYHSIGASVENNERDFYFNPTVRINNWFDKNQFYPATPQEKQNFRETLGIPKSSFVVISSGSCTHVKNHHDILVSLSLIESDIDIVYLHLGSGQTEAEERQLAERLGIISKVRFLGNQINVRDYLVCSDLFIMPSKFEGLGNSALEAMACGLPSILYNCPGLRDLISSNDNGMLIEGSSKALAQAIVQIYNSPEDAERYSKNAQQFVNTEFSMQQNVNQLANLYKTMAEKIKVKE